MRNDALGVVSELAASPNNVFTRAQAAARGIDHRQIAHLLAAGLADEPWPGVLVGLVGGVPPTWRQRLAAATVLTNSRDPIGTALRCVASTRSAGRLHRLEGLVGDEIDLLVRSPAKVRLAGVRAQRTLDLPPHDVVVIEGIPCTNIARTLADLASLLPAERVERAFDDAIRRGVNRRWLRSTAERLRRPGQSGPPLLLALLDDLDRRGTVRGSWFEKLVEACLDHPDLAGLTRQYRLEAADGARIATFDLAIPDAKLGIEAHSRKHHFDREDEASDEHRDHRAGVAGWDVMYLGYQSVQSPATVLQKVLDRVRSRRALLADR